MTKPFLLRFTLSAVMAFAMTSLAGCAWRQPTPRPTLEDLFQEAVNQSNQNPENILGEPDIIDGIEIGPDGEPISLDSEGKARHAQGLRVTESGGVRHVSDVEELPRPGARARLAYPPNETIINELFQDTDIREAIDVLAAQAKVSIIVDDKARGIVNATIDNLPFEKALDKIVLPLGLVYARHEEHYVVGIPDPMSALFPRISELHQYRPKHHRASDLRDVLPSRLQKYTTVTEKSNFIAIDAPKTLAQSIIDQLHEIDTPTPQVTLEAMVCVISPDCGLQFGLDWNHAFQVNGSDAFSVGVQNLELAGKVSPFGVRNAFDDFAVTQAFVKLLAQNGYLSIRAAPRVTAKDGEKAVITIGRETFFSPNPVQTGANSSGNVIFSQNIQKIDSGITLDLTPTIRGDEVTVNIEKAEVSEDIRTTSADLAANPYPVINRRSVSTTVHVRDGKTIVIGGLVQRQVVERITKIPYLSKIPVMGAMFEQVQRQEKDAEVVIFISPKVTTPMIARDGVVGTSIQR
jgi:type IV pilus assembly protein PilQ